MQSLGKTSHEATRYVTYPRRGLRCDERLQ